jgi:hypothetical protein
MSEAPASRRSRAAFLSALAIGAFLVSGVAVAQPRSQARSQVKSAEPPAMTPFPPPRPAEFAAPPAAKTPAATPAQETAKPAPVQAPVIAQPEGPPAPPEPSCLATLTAIAGNRVRPADATVNAGKDAACHVVEPVVVEALSIRNASGDHQVTFDPPVTLSCAMASTVATWLGTSVQPLVRGHFERDLAGLRVGGGHECRRRNRATAGPISEHATGKALDIFAFMLTGEKAGQKVVVEKPEGPAQGNFLKAIRQSACGAFNTSLGPGSDAAHANHLHVDTQERRSPSTRFCQ